jgi:cell division protein FtsN
MSDTRGPEYEGSEPSLAPPEAAPEATEDVFVEAEAELVGSEDARPRARLLPMWILLAAIILVGVAWAVSDRYFGESSDGQSVPLITAEETPVKVRPEEPGGVDVPDRDKYVYKSLTDKEPDAEQLLPPPEEPMERPTVEVTEIEAPPPESAEPAGLAEESVAEVVEEAPDPGSPDELAVVAVAPPDIQEEVLVEDVEPVVEAPAPRVDAPEAPIQQAEDLLDKVTLEPEPVPEPAPEPPSESVLVSEPEPEPEPAPVPEPEAKIEAKAAPSLSADNPGFMVQVGATQNEAAAGDGLTRFAKQHPSILAAFGTIVVRADLGDKGVWYRMRVGPFATRAEAAGVCGQLKAVDVGCYVVAN